MHNYHFDVNGFEVYVGTIVAFIKPNTRVLSVGRVTKITPTGIIVEYEIRPGLMGKTFMANKRFVSLNR